jgi:uncharacterized protein YecE (DUF72 family)
MARAYVGTSGWSYDHWRHGVVYPEGLPANQWLAWLSQEFDSVELNNSFYRTPKRESVQRWSDTVPPGFRFAVKLWRAFTHYNRLEDPNDRLPSVMSVFEPLRADQRGPLLVQIPPQMKVDVAKLDRFLRRLEPYGWTVCLEVRDASWHTPGVRRVLDDHGATLCVHDMMWAGPSTEPNEAAPVVYVRRHGPNSRYGGTYTDERIAADAADVRRWLAGGRDVYVYYNNDGKGYAVRDARRLRQALGLPDRSAPTATGAPAPAPARPPRPSTRRPARRSLPPRTPRAQRARPRSATPPRSR